LQISFCRRCARRTPFRRAFCVGSCSALCGWVGGGVGKKKNGGVWVVVFCGGMGFGLTDKPPRTQGTQVPWDLAMGWFVLRAGVMGFVLLLCLFSTGSVIGLCDNGQFSDRRWARRAPSCFATPPFQEAGLKRTLPAIISIRPKSVSRVGFCGPFHRVLLGWRPATRRGEAQTAEPMC